MKRAVVIIEGAADLPCRSLEGKTPLQVARLAQLSQWAERGRLGLVAASPSPGISCGGRLLGLLLGLDRAEADQLQQGPLEAAAVAETLDGYGSAYCGQFVLYDGGLLKDVPAMDESETAKLAEDLQVSWDPSEVRFLPAGRGRFLVLVKSREPRLYGTRPPAFLHGIPERDLMVLAERDGTVAAVHRLAGDILEDHPVNAVRVDLGQNPVTGICLWGGGALPAPGRDFRPPESRAVVLGGCRMAEGFARAFQQDWVALKYNDARRDAADGAFSLSDLVHAGQDHDLLIMYLHASGGLGDHGNTREKVSVLERMDQRILRPFAEYLESQRPYRLLVAAEGLVASEERLPSEGAVPVLLAGDGVEADRVMRWEEEAAAAGKLGVLRSEQLKELLTEE